MLDVEELRQQIRYTFIETMSQEERDNAWILRPDFFRVAKASQHVYSDKENYYMFRVETPKLDGKVIIKLDEGLDLYNLEFWIVKMYDKEPYLYSKRIKTIEGVYCDQLGEILKEELGL